MTVAWVDSTGAHHHAQARCLDASETGLRLELPRRVDAGCYINIKAERYKLNASAKVRNIVAGGIKYQVGLEFNSGWKWKDLARAIAARERAGID